MAAEGQGNLICLWIFRFFSSLILLESLGFLFFRTRRERTSLAPLAQAVPSPFPLFLPRSTSQGLQALRRAAAPIDLGGSEGGRGGSPAPVALRGTKNPPFAGGSRFSLRAGRQVIDDDDSSTRSVGRSVSRSHRRGSLRPRSGGMSGVSVWDSVHYPAAFSRSSFGTPSRPAITQRGIS